MSVHLAQVLHTYPRPQPEGFTAVFTGITSEAFSKGSLSFSFLLARGAGERTELWHPLVVGMASPCPFMPFVYLGMYTRLFRSVRMLRCTCLRVCSSTCKYIDVCMCTHVCSSVCVTVSTQMSTHVKSRGRQICERHIWAQSGHECLEVLTLLH